MNAKETYTCKCKSGQHLNSCVGTYTHEFMCWPQKSPKGISEISNGKESFSISAGLFSICVELFCTVHLYLKALFYLCFCVYLRVLPSLCRAPFNLCRALLHKSLILYGSFLLV